MTIPVSYQADWDLFVGWCQHAGIEPRPDDPLDRFFADVPVAAPTTLNRRIKAIRAGLEDRGFLPARSMRAPAVTTIRTGPEWASVAEALAQLQILRYPAGVRGRRDGWVLVTVGFLSLTRAQARSIRADQVELGESIRVGGRIVKRSEPAVSCPACAVTRWLRILGPGGVMRNEAIALMNPYTADLSAHDCEIPVEDGWQAMPTLMPYINRHNSIGSMHEPLTPLAISAIMRRRQEFNGFREQTSTHKELTGRFAAATSQDLADAYDDIDDQLTALLARTAQILAEGDGLSHPSDPGAEDS